MPSLSQLEAELAHLQVSLPEPGSEADRRFDYDAFQAQLDQLVDRAGPADRAHLRSRAECLLGSAGLIPSDNEGEPCG